MSLEILDKYTDIDFSTLPAPSEEYWKKDAELCKELEAENEATRKSLVVSSLKMFERFTI